MREDALVAGELLVGGEEVGGGRLRGRRRAVGLPQPPVELGRLQVDVVAEALVAEADVERDDPPVREAAGRLGKVGGRVEHDRRVLGGQVHEGDSTRLGRGGPPARWIASTISSSG